MSGGHFDYAQFHLGQSGPQEKIQMKYNECHGCYWKYNGGCIRPKGDLCPGKIVLFEKKKVDKK